MILPKAKLENIVVQQLKGELLVYNLTTHQAFQLNQTLRTIYQSCDGNTNFEDLKRQHKFTDDLIHFALGELKASNLVESDLTNHFAGLSRREVIKKVGLATMIALPVITGLTAPPAAAAQSVVACRGVLASCTFIDYQQSNCCDGLRCYQNSQCNACNPQGSSVFCNGAGCCATQSGNACCNGYTETARGGTQKECICQ